MSTTIIQMNGNDYEVVQEEGKDPKVFVLVLRRAESRFGGIGLSGPIRRTIKPQSQNWKRAIRLAKQGAAA